MSAIIKVGDVFGRLKVTRVYSKQVVYGGYAKTYGCVDADCSCGTVCKGIWSRGLLRGSTRSCNCLRAEMVRANNKRRSARVADFRLGLEEIVS